MGAFDDYVDPVGRSPTTADAPAAPEVGYAEDIGKGIVGGLGRGVTGMIGGAGSVGDLARAGLAKAGVPESVINFGARVARGALPFGMGLAASGPSAADVQGAVEDYTGKFYQPKTMPGQYASTIAEFAPSAVIPGGGGAAARAFNVIVPALASESAGQLTKDTAAEPWARALTGLAAGPVVGKLVTPAAPASAWRQAATATLEDAGIPVMAGQRTGSRPIQWAEATAADMPFAGGRAAELNSAQTGGLNRAMTEGMYDRGQLTARGVPENVNLPDPRVVAAGKQSLGDEYTRLANANQIRSDPALMSDMHGVLNNYERNVLPSQRSTDIHAIMNDVIDHFVQNNGTMAGDVYQATRSRLGRLANSTNDSELKIALAGAPGVPGPQGGLQGALDRAMQRNLSPADAAAWALNNQRYANMKQFENAVARAGENLSPAALAQSARTGRAYQNAAQIGSLDPLVKAAEILKPLPQSGTGPRTAWQQLYSIPAMLMAGGGTGYGTGSLLTGAAVAAAPFAAARAILSRPGQAYLGNQLLPQNARDAITQALVQQAASQPSGVARNQAAQADYERKRVEDLRKAGLRQ